MTPKQVDILRYLSDRYAVFIASTEIGEAVGGKLYGDPSSWARPTLNILVKKGFAERAEDRGHYRITKLGSAESSIRRNK